MKRWMVALAVMCGLAATSIAMAGANKSLPLTPPRVRTLNPGAACVHDTQADEAHEKYCVWLRPSGRDRQRLTGQIRYLAGQMGSYPFEPHMTLVPDMDGPEAEFIQKAQRLAGALHPFTVRLRGVQDGDQCFRCVFVRAYDDPELMQAHELGLEVFGARDEQAFTPHISLLYGQYGTDAQFWLALQLNDRRRGRCFPDQFRAASLYVVTATGDPDQWRVVTEIPFGR